MAKPSYLEQNTGFTLIEMIVVLFIFILLLQGITTLFSDTFSANTALTGNLSAQGEVRKAFTSMVADIRSASPSSSGAYTIDTASSTYFAYYSDIDNDGLKEKIRYFLTGKTIKAGVIKPTGSPPVYNPSNEKISTLINDVVNAGSQPIFTYYDNAYDGTTAPLNSPISIPAVRLIKINVLIDHDSSRQPAAISFSTQVSIRNLKDNL
jgi:prepilin-type N-terminal cleavage/methylation domain-containing protein